MPAFAPVERAVADFDDVSDFVEGEVDGGVCVLVAEVGLVTSGVCVGSSGTTEVKLRANIVEGRARIDVILMVGPPGRAVLRSCHVARSQMHSNPPRFQSRSVLDMLKGL